MFSGFGVPELPIILVVLGVLVGLPVYLYKRDRKILARKQ